MDLKGSLAESSLSCLVKMRFSEIWCLGELVRRGQDDRAGGSRLLGGTSLNCFGGCLLTGVHMLRWWCCEVMSILHQRAGARKQLCLTAMLWWCGCPGEF